MFPSFKPIDPKSEPLQPSKPVNLKRTFAAQDLSQGLIQSDAKKTKLTPAELNQLFHQPLVRTNAVSDVRSIIQQNSNNDHSEEQKTTQIKKPNQDLAIAEMHLKASVYFSQKGIKFTIQESDRYYSHHIKIEPINNMNDSIKKVHAVHKDLVDIIENLHLKPAHICLSEGYIFQFKAAEFSIFINNLQSNIKNQKTIAWFNSLRSCDHYFPDMLDRNVRKNVKDFLITQKPADYGFFVDSKSNKGAISLSIYKVQDDKAQEKTRYSMENPQLDLLAYCRNLEKDLQITMLLYSSFLAYSKELLEKTQIIDQSPQKSPGLTG